MTYRVDRIKLSPQSPLGEVLLENLALADLIVISGENGAGKSTLLAPLRKTSKENKNAVGCISSKSGAEIEFSATGINQDATFLTATELMAKFRDLSTALAVAADTTRMKHEGRLLNQFLKKLQNESVRADDEVAPGLKVLWEKYLYFDGRCQSPLRTNEHYEELGRRLAHRKGEHWTPIDPNDENRRSKENLLRPEFRHLVGWTHARSNLQTLEYLNVASKFESVQATLLRKVQETSELLPTINLDDVGESHYEKALCACKRLKEAATAYASAIEAMDHLRACRKNALEYLAGDGPGAQAIQDCPVCGKPEGTENLRQSLQVHCKKEEDSQEKRQFLENKKALDVLYREIEAEIEAYKSECSRYDGIGAVIRKWAGESSVPDEWHSVVKAALRRLNGACDEWQKKHGEAPSVEGFKEAQIIGRFRVSCG